MNAQPQQVEKSVIAAFLNDTDWAGAEQIAMGADMGLRRYKRLEKNGRRALFMDMSRSGILETGLKEYVEVGEYLKKIGINTPEIYHYDLKSGLAVIEEVGQVSFGYQKNNGYNPPEIYQKATDVLVQIKNQATENVLPLVGYKKTLIRERLRQFVDYYVPAVTDAVASPQLVEDFETVLNDIALSLPSCPMGFCHADFHLENLMWCPEKPGGYGLIDFQDAFWGFKGYDLLNLLEDARQTVPSEIKKAMKDRYCEGMDAQDREIFEQWYALMSIHFHCRVIGLFIKFAREKGGVQFLAHIPRLQGYITENLKNPVLLPLKEWMESHSISFNINPKN
ncbi:MAG: phosphotransferase [Alphaproteobacteria bacterium]|nr:phosphotransferase [Alphaproteobacteria bacterium]